MARWVVGHECEVERVRSRYSTTIMLTARPPIGGRFWDDMLRRKSDTVGEKIREGFVHISWVDGRNSGHV